MSRKTLESFEDAFVALATSRPNDSDEPEWKLANVCGATKRLHDRLDDLCDERGNLTRLKWRQRRLLRWLRLLIAVLEEVSGE